MNGIGLFVDIFFVVAAIIIVAACAKRGFINNVLKLVSFILSVILAWMFCPMLSDYIAENWLDEKITGVVYEQVISLSQRNGGQTFDIASLFDTEQHDFMQLLQRFGVDVDSLASTFRSISEGTEETVMEMAQTISEKVVHALSVAIAFVLVFVAAIILLSLISALINTVAKLPVLKQLNTFLGFLCGVVIAIAFVYVFSTVGVFLLEKLYAIFPDTIPANIKEQSFILQHFSDIEPLIEFVEGLKQ